MQSERIHLVLVVRHLVGGIRTYLRYVYSLLPPTEYRLTLVTVAGAETEVLRGDLAMHSIAIREVDATHPMQALAAEIRDLRRHDPPDVIHANGFSAATAVAAVNLCPRLPVIVTSHDVVNAHPFQETIDLAKRILLLSALWRADVVQSVSSDAQLNLLAALPPLRWHRGLLVIPNGIPVGFGRRLEPRPPCGPAPARVSFLFAGRPMPQKGFRDVIAAAEALRGGDPFRVVVCSEGGFLREYRDEVHQRGLDEWFDFRGFVPAIEAVLSEVDAQLMPSLWEACGLAAMESLVAGCPLIASTCIGLREVVAGTPALTVPPCAPHQLAGAMEAVIRDRAAFKHAAIAYRSLAAERFDVARTAAALDQVVRRLVGGGAS